MTDSTGCIAGDPVGDLGGFAVLLCVPTCLHGSSARYIEPYEPNSSYAVPFGVNCLLLAATAYRSWKVSRQLDGIKLPTHRRLLNDGAVYFVCITVINAINVYFYCRMFQVFPKLTSLRNSLDCWCLNRTERSIEVLRGTRCHCRVVNSILSSRPLITQTETSPVSCLSLKKTFRFPKLLSLANLSLATTEHRSVVVISSLSHEEVTWALVWTSYYDKWKLRRFE